VSHCTAPHPLTAGSKQDMTLCVRQAESGVRKSCTRVVDGDVDRRPCEKQAGARREGSRGRAQRSSGCFLHGVRCRVGALVAIWPCPWTFLLSVSTPAGEGGRHDGKMGHARSCVCMLTAVSLMPPRRHILVTHATCLTRCRPPYVARYDDAHAEPQHENIEDSSPRPTPMEP
jgi:hypothetical protein